MSQQPCLIHPSAVVDPGARMGNNVRIGPFSFPEEAEVTLAKVKNYGIYNAKIVQD